MKYDIFISYKRGGSSSATAAYLYDLLTKKGYSVFFDRKEIRQGQFNTQLFEQIENATDIFILLDDHSLKACFSDIKDTYKTDWFCMEVMHSLLKQKRIIPLLLEGYSMPDAEVLPEEMKALCLQNAISLDIADIEDFYKKYLIDQEYLASKPRNLYLSQARGKGVADFLFYSDGECDIFECGNLIGTLNSNIDEDHPYRHPVERCGEHRFYCINNDTCEEQRITESIDVNSQKYISIKWTTKQNLWDLKEDDIKKQDDSRILYAWGKGLYEGTSKHDPNTKLSFICLKEAANKWNIDARNYIVDHVKGLFATELTIDDRIAWYEKAIEFDSADAYEILGRYYDEGIEVKQDLDKALEYGNKALQLRIEKYGEMNADVAMSCHNLGRVYSAKGELAKSLDFYKKALNIRLSIYGKVHPELAKTLNNIAIVYNKLNMEEESAKAFLKTIEMKKELYGDGHLSLIPTYFSLAYFAKEKDNYDDALTYYMKVLKIREDILGEQDIQTADSYNAIAELYNDIGDVDKKLEYCRKAISIIETKLKENPDDTKLYNKTAWTLFLLGRYEEALPWAEKAVAAYPNKSEIIDTLANIYQCLGRNKEALEQFELRLKLLKEQNGSPKVIRKIEEKIAALKESIENGGISEQ